MNDWGIIASCLCPLSKITNPENTTQFKLVKDYSSNRVNDFLVHNTIAVTLYNNFLTFRDKKFEFKGDKNYNVDLASLWDKKLMYDFGKEMNFDVKATGNKSTRHRSLIKLLKSPGLMISASGISNTIFLPSDPNDLSDRLKLLPQEKKPETILI